MVLDSIVLVITRMESGATATRIQWCANIRRTKLRGERRMERQGKE